MSSHPSPATESLKPNIPCPEGQARNLSTGRCRKIPRKCPPGKMRNKATRRCVTTKTCPPGHIRNPRSHRCKRITRAKSKTSPRHTVKSRTPTPGPHVEFKSKVSHIKRSRSNRNSKGTISIRHSSRSTSSKITTTGKFSKIKSKLEKSLKFPKGKDVAVDVALEPIKGPGVEGIALSIHESAQIKSKHRHGRQKGMMHSGIVQRQRVNAADIGEELGNDVSKTIADDIGKELGDDIGKELGEKEAIKKANMSLKKTTVKENKNTTDTEDAADNIYRYFNF